MEVHRIFGPGPVEKNYEEALAHELFLRGLRVQRQQSIQVPHKDIILESPLRYDMLVEDLVVVENKAVMEIHAVFQSTLLSYMKHLKVPKGILFNFHVRNIFSDGQKTFVNEFYAALPEE
jgi:GxxExxY protein